ncbi:hypothetical protein QYE76_011130 [Lolium multiflorum]|uniref:Subtilisin-like protease fibronectin type-III domain-containing protein n=1 Tax=Lolium multiflorum TaxID=4521 RepID=A0AAD8TYD5_LOLMU|nr:hypothetical protein QYE76_011130 [Lolium multiflorum]
MSGRRDPGTPPTFTCPSGQWLNVMVEPEELEFEAAMEKKTFTVTVSREGDGGQLAEGSLHWKSEDHLVRSPIIADARVVTR